MTGPLQRLVTRETARLGRARYVPVLLAAIVGLASVLLLALSGWFLAGAALAGAGGAVTARLFNYMLPAAAIRLMAIARTGARYGERVSGHGVALTVMARVRGTLYGSIAAMPPVRALAIGRGDAVARIVQDVGVIETQAVRRPSRWNAITAVTIAALVAAAAGWRAALYAAAVLVGGIAIGHVLARRLARPERSIQRETGLLKECVLTYADAAAELRCLAMGDRALAEIERAAAALDHAALNHGYRCAALDAVIPLVAMCAGTGVLALAAAAGPAVAALAALGAMAAAGELGTILREFADHHNASDAQQRLDEILEWQALPTATIALSRRPDVWIPDHGVAQCGTTVMLSGPSGSGKTTLIETLIALRPARAGMARIDGIDIALIPPATLRATFAWLPQDAQLLTGTVRDNLALACPDGDDALFWAALEDAMIADRVRAMPRGLDSWIGENGMRLSGGERRRVALARAFCVDAPWLLLDEPLAGLDRATATALADRLDRRIVARGQGMIMASHQIATLAQTAIPGRRIPAPMAVPDSVPALADCDHEPTIRTMP